MHLLSQSAFFFNGMKPTKASFCSVCLFNWSMILVQFYFRHTMPFTVATMARDRVVLPWVTSPSWRLILYLHRFVNHKP